MNEKEKTGIIATAISLFMAILLVTLGFMFVKLRDTQNRLAELEKGTSESFTAQQEQLNDLSTNVEGLWNGVGEVNQSIDQVNQDISEIKNVQHNTNQALSRLRKQKEELEKKLEEGLELKRQRIEQARAARNNTFFESVGGYAQGLADGVFELTAYAWTGNPCANGEYPVEGYSVASNYYPIGTRLYIEGVGERVVTDTGGMSSGVIDLYLGDEETCIQFGRQSANVYVIEE